MILFENGIIKLDYNPVTDVVEVKYPDLYGYLLPEIKHHIDMLVEIIKNYDVKRVLLDSTSTVVSVTADEARQVTQFLANGLAQTRVQKLARLQSYSEAIENQAKANIEHAKQTFSLPFEVQNFNDKALALEWLLQVVMHQQSIALKEKNT